MTDKQTKTPWQHYWRKSEDGQEADCGIFSEPRTGMVWSVARCPRYQTEARWEADASLICRAVNSYDDLVAALQVAEEYCEYSHIRRIINAALARAGVVM